MRTDMMLFSIVAILAVAGMVISSPSPHAHVVCPPGEFVGEAYTPDGQMFVTCMTGSDAELFTEKYGNSSNVAVYREPFYENSFPKKQMPEDRLTVVVRKYNDDKWWWNEN